MKSAVLTILVALCVPAISQAQAVDLYSGSVVVPNQSESEREAAFPRALRQVLGKLSGLRDFEAYPEVAAATQNARSLVVSFHYRQASETPVAGFRGAEATPGPAAGEITEDFPGSTHLVATFSRSGVDELMRGLGLPRWPASRVPLEIWVLVDDGVSRRVLPMEYAYLKPQIEQVASERGMPVRWPQPDAEGNYDADLQLLWGGYTETLLPDDAEAQTGGDGAGQSQPRGEALDPREAIDVLIMAARREGPEWNARLMLEYEGQHWSARNRDIDLARALAEGTHQAIDEIVAAQSIAPSDQGIWAHRITIAAVTNAEDYARCLSYLQSLGIVDRVGVEGADAQGVRLQLTLNAAPQYFEQVLADDGLLESGEMSGHYVLTP